MLFVVVVRRCLLLFRVACLLLLLVWPVWCCLLLFAFVCFNVCFCCVLLRVVVFVAFLLLF